MATYLRLLTSLRPHLTVFGIAAGCMVVGTLLDGIQLGSLFVLADRIVTDTAIPSPAWLPAWLAVLVARFNATDRLVLLSGFALAIPILFSLKGLFEFWRSFYMADVSQRIVRDMRQTVFTRLMGQSIDFHNKESTGSLMSRVTYDTSVIQNSVTEGLTDLVFQGCQVLMYLTIALTIDWAVALFIFVLVPIMAWVIARIGKFLKKLSHQSQAAMGALNTTLHESFMGVRIIQAFRAEETIQRKFAAVNERSYRVLRRLQKRMGFLSPVTELLGAIGGAVFFWYGGRQVLSGTMTLGTFLVFLGSMLSLVHPLKRLARLHGIIQQALASAERIFGLLDEPTKVADQPDARALSPLSHEIHYEHVSFHYETKPALRDISLTIPYGETLALVGPSGGGKTTFVNLLPRFFDPTSGRVTIDGTDLRSVTLASLRGQVALVTQETFLFDDTLRANIALGCPQAALADVIEAAKAANAHAFITKLPSGYETVIGQAGGSLSGGERQRVAIARAFLKNPRILILDEATSQLDAESEHLIGEALERLMKGRTVLLIAHRLSTVRLAHRIALVQEGRIVEQGQHDELLRKNPLYRRFCELQLISLGATPALSSP